MFPYFTDYDSASEIEVPFETSITETNVSVVRFNTLVQGFARNEGAMPLHGELHYQLVFGGGEFPIRYNESLDIDEDGSYEFWAMNGVREIYHII